MVQEVRDFPQWGGQISSKILPSLVGSTASFTWQELDSKLPTHQILHLRTAQSLIHLLWCLISPQTAAIKRFARESTPPLVKHWPPRERDEHGQTREQAWQHCTSKSSLLQMMLLPLFQCPQSQVKTEWTWIVPHWVTTSNSNNKFIRKYQCSLTETHGSLISMQLPEQWEKLKFQTYMVKTNHKA